MVGWVFTPDMGATSDEPDYDYLHYGFWLKKTADADGAPPTTRSRPSPIRRLTRANVMLMSHGSATYNGGATGVYVNSVVNSDGSRVAATAGQFAADASLTATFGADVWLPFGRNITGLVLHHRAQLLGTVTGTIDNFALEHGEGQQWSVALKGTYHRMFDGAWHRQVTSTARPMAEEPRASFSATFHGPGGRDTQPSPWPWSASSAPTSATAQLPVPSERGSSFSTSQQVRVRSMRT